MLTSSGVLPPMMHIPPFSEAEYFADGTTWTDFEGFVLAQTVTVDLTYEMGSEGGRNG